MSKKQTNKNIFLRQDVSKRTEILYEDFRQFLCNYEDNGEGGGGSGVPFLQADTISDLRLLVPEEDNNTVELLGYYSVGDKPPLFYQWTEGSNFIDNGGNIIVPQGSTEGAWIAVLGSDIDIRHFGARNLLAHDSTIPVQNAINYCYEKGELVFIPIGNYQITRAIYVPTGVNIHGASKVNSLIRTPFRRKPTAYKTPEEKAMAVIAVANLELSKGERFTATQGSMDLDLANGHNRFYLGDGMVGYFDADREHNPSHPYYYPEPPFSDDSNAPDLESTTHAIWRKWFEDREAVQNQGRFIGTTGRENYANGLFKSTDHPNLRHTLDPLNASYIRHRAGCLVHCGNRHNEYYNFKIQTNSEDRGKDTCINYNYPVADLKGDLTTYDSSILGHRFDGLWLFESGGSGISLYRSVNTEIANCLAQRCAVFGFFVNGVTSTNIVGCYSNGCLEAGFRLVGVHYSSLQGCASDSCSKAYVLNNCSTVTMIGCGYEALKLILDDDLITDEGSSYSAIYPGKGIQIQNSVNITIINPYGSTAREQYTRDTDEIDASGIDLTTMRHVSIVSSRDVTIMSPNFKSYIRWRTGPFRSPDNSQVPSAGRYWEFQNRLVDAIFEVRGDGNRAYLNSPLRVSDIRYENQDRTKNLDIVDLGTVPHPDGLDTAGKAISGLDGNGGWKDSNGAVITAYDIEKRFPMKNKKEGEAWDKYWDWRRSLVLVRLRYYGTLTIFPPEGLSPDLSFPFRNGYGYVTMIERNELPYPVDWSNITPEKWTGFLIDKETAREYGQSYVDQSAIGTEIYDYAPLSLSKGKINDDLTGNLSPISVVGPINGRARNFDYGPRAIYNSFEDTLDHILKAGHGFQGNLDTKFNHIEPIMALKMPIRNSEKVGWDYPAMIFTDTVDSQLLKIYPDQKGVIGRGEGMDTTRMLSFNAGDRAKITKLNGSDTLLQTINRVNNIIDRLRGHGLIIEGDEGENFTLYQVDVLPITAGVWIDGLTPTQVTIERGKKSFRALVPRSTPFTVEVFAPGYDSQLIETSIGATPRVDTVELVGNTNHVITVVPTPSDAKVEINIQGSEEGYVETNSITALIGSLLFIKVSKEGYVEQQLSHTVTTDTSIPIVLNPVPNWET